MEVYDNVLVFCLSYVFDKSVHCLDLRVTVHVVVVSVHSCVLFIDEALVCFFLDHPF